jgi:hypothetical protein
MSDTIAPVASRADWKGPGLDWREEGMHVLTAAEVAEIDAALRGLTATGPVDFPDITAERFPLPTLGAFFRRQLHELRHGRGFLLLRGLPREKYSADEMALIYFGLGAHLGTTTPQSWQGEVLGHVVDISDIDQGVRGYNAGGGQNMHTDSCDIVALMCLRAAKSGGKSRIASAVAVHNHLAATRPDLLKLLYEGFTFRRMERDSDHGTGKILQHVTVFRRRGEEVTSYISGSYPVRAVKAGDATMTPAQEEALKAFFETAASPEFHLDMSIGEGDIQFLNNRLLVHGRTDYQDWPEVTRRRHMMRLWLRVPGWPDMTDSQAMHTPVDHRLWLRQRRPFMEVPSTFLAEKARKQAAAA